MTMRTDGIVIREQNTGDQDRLITVLTKEKGIIKAFVNGGRNPKNKNVSSTGLLCYSDFSVEKTKKDVCFIKEATSKKVFFSLRQDITVLSLAQYLAELVYELAPREEEAGEFLPLMLNSLHLLSKGEKDRGLIKTVAELRMLSLSGYMPQLVSCKKCGVFESEKMYLDILTGELFCENCRTAGRLYEMNAGMVRAMRHICLSEPSKIFSFSLPEPSLVALGEISEKYLLGITNRRFKTLSFYKTMTEF
ncbi:MAG: DNA repair protein RecO [Clostridia bacterium]|nr:DNA repair protein RecO [Clostridia bacterium]